MQDLSAAGGRPQDLDAQYVGYGVMSYNLHVIGRELLALAQARAEPVRQAA